MTIANDDSDEGPYTFKIHGTGLEAISPFAHNQALPQDVNADERVSTSDLLILVNTLLQTQTATPLVASESTPSYYLDVNADGRISTSDLLMVVNYLLTRSATPQATPAAATPLAAEADEASLVLFDDTNTQSASASGARIELTGSTAESESAPRTPVVAPLASSAVDAALTDDEDDDQPAENAELEWDLLALDV